MAGGTLDPGKNLGVRPKDHLLAFSEKQNRPISLLQAFARVKTINHSWQVGERVRNENRAVFSDCR